MEKLFTIINQSFIKNKKFKDGDNIIEVVFEKMPDGTYQAKDVPENIAKRFARSSLVDVKEQKQSIPGPKVTSVADLVDKPKRGRRKKQQDKAESPSIPDLVDAKKAGK